MSYIAHQRVTKFEENEILMRKGLCCHGRERALLQSEEEKLLKMATSRDEDATETLNVCLQMLQEELDKDSLTACVNTLKKIFSNILSKGNEDKFRHLKKENKTFHNKVWQYDGAQQLMLACGWVENETEVFLPADVNIGAANTVLNTFISQNCATPNTSPPGVSPSSTSSQVDTSTNWTKDELTEKDRLIAEERKKLLAQLKREKEEKRRITEQIRSDRKDANTREVKESHARHLEAGGKMTKFGDIGIDLNKGGG